MDPLNLHQLAVQAMRSRGLLPTFAPQALREAEAARAVGPERKGTICLWWTNSYTDVAADRSFSSGVNGDCAGRSQNLMMLDITTVSSGTACARPTQAHSHAGGPACAKPKLYNPRHPERTLLYQTIAEHFETWFELASAAQSLSSTASAPA